MCLNHPETIPAPLLVFGKKCLPGNQSGSLMPQRLGAATDSFGEEFS